MQPSALKSAIIALLAAQLAFPPSTWANPAGEVVTHGSATFTRNGNELIIKQGSDKLITKWGSFSIAQGERTQFIQPTKNSAALNRVVGGSRSIIDGELSANGKVILINPAGVTVGPTGVVNVNSFTASAHDITDKEFIGGGDLLYKGASQETVENLGTIRASGGDAILIAKHVKNAGLIEAKNGVAALVGGTEVLVKPSGEERIFIKPGSEKGASVTQSATGRIAAASAEIKAAGNPYATAINLEGLVTVKGTVGKVKVAGGAGDTRIAGTIKAQKSNGVGGDVAISGDRVLLASTSIVDASGTKGGTVKIGGGFQGKDTTIQNASQTIVSSGAQILADATASNGAGGTVILWADDTTAFYGSISAKGLGKGSGGFAEVSGKTNLIFEGVVDLSSELGTIGTLLLDPMNIEVIGTASATSVGQVDQFADANLGTITGGQPGSQIRNTVINAATANVVLQATNDIIVAAAISMINAGVGIALQAGNNINLNSSILTKGGTITLLAGDSSSGAPHPVGGGNITGTGASTLNAGTAGIVTLRAANNISLTSAVTTAGGSVSLTAGDAALGTVDPASGNLSVAAVTVGTGGSVNLRAANNVNLNGAISSVGGPITVLAGDSSTGAAHPVGGGNITGISTVNSGATGGGNVTLRAANNISQTGNVTSGGGTVSIFAGDSTLGAADPAGGGNLSIGLVAAGAAGNINLRAANNANLNGALSSIGGAITVLAGDATSGSSHPVGGGNIAGISTLNAGAGGTVNFRAANNISQTGALITGGGSVSMVAGDASLGASDPIGGGNLSIAAVNTGTGGNLNLRAANNVNLNSTLTTSGGSITVLAGDSSTGSTYPAGGGSITTSASALNSGAASAGNVTLRAANNVNLNGGITAVGGSVTLIAGDPTLGTADPTGSVTTGTGAAITVGAGTTGNVTMEGANVSINRGITLGNGNLTVKARTGDIQLRNAVPITHGNGDILFDAAQNVILKGSSSIGQVAGSVGGSKSLIARAGDLILDSSAAVLSQVDGMLTLTAGHDILVYSQVTGSTNTGITTLNVTAGNDLIVGNGFANYHVDTTSGSLDTALTGDRLTTDSTRTARLISSGQVNVDVANDIFILASTTSVNGNGSASLGFTSGSGRSINVEAKTLSIIAGAINLTAGLGHIQPSFVGVVGIDPTGVSDINVTLSGGTGTGITGKSLVLRGGDGVSSSAILGTGGQVTNGTARSDLNVNVVGGALLQGGNSSCFAMIGNSGVSAGVGGSPAVNSDGASGGKINFSATGDVDLKGGYADYARAVIGTSGNNGYQTMDINVNVGGNLTLENKVNRNSSAVIGAGTPGLIDADVYVAVGGNLTLNSVTGYTGIAIRSTGVTAAGDVNVLVGGDISLFATGMSGINVSNEASISGADLTNVTAGGNIIVVADDEGISAIGSHNANSQTVIQSIGNFLAYSSNAGEVVLGGRSVPFGLPRDSDQSLTLRSAGDIQITDPIVATGNGNIFIEAGATFASGALWGANASNLNGRSLAGSTFGSGSFTGTPFVTASTAVANDGLGAFTVYTDDAAGTSITTENGNLTLLSQAFHQDVFSTVQGLVIEDVSALVDGSVSVSSTTGNVTVAGFHDILVGATGNVSTAGNILLAAWRDLDIAAGGQINAGQKITLVVDEQAGTAAGDGWFRNAGNVVSATDDIAIYAVYGPQNVKGTLEFVSQVDLGNLASLAAFAPGGSLDGKFSTSYKGGGAVHGAGFSQYLAGNGVTGASAPGIWYKLPVIPIVIPPVDPPVDPPVVNLPPVHFPVVSVAQVYAIAQSMTFLDPKDQFENDLEEEGNRTDARYQNKRFAMNVDKEKYAAAVKSWGGDADQVTKLSKLTDREYFMERKSFLSDAFNKRSQSENVER